VEDERMVRELMARGLREAGYRSIEASDGEQALKLVQDSTEPIHLVVSDVVMPGLSGRELGNRLAALRPGVPILYMSAYSSDEVVHRGLLAERDLFVAKPVTPDALVRRVREILG
jgi:DNA-binding response OmpR family regulator